jgi:hypothetical protein
MKFECIFASEERQTSTHTTEMKGDISYPFGSVVDASILPSVSLYGPLSFCEIGWSLATSGKQTASLLYITQISFVMPNSNEICAGVKYSSTSAGRSGAKSVSYRKYEVEKNAKNQAYHFILSNGLLEEFAEFCRGHHARDAHKDCVDILLSII